MSNEGMPESIPLQHKSNLYIRASPDDGSNVPISDQEAGATAFSNGRSTRAVRIPTTLLSHSQGYSVLPDEDDNDEDGTETTPVTVFIQKMIVISPVTRFALYLVPIAVALAIPIILTATVLKNAMIGDIRLIGLFVWIEVVWLNVWLAILIAFVLPFVIQFFAGFISSGSRQYAQLFKAMMPPMSVFIWALISKAATPIICAFDVNEGRKERCDDQWVLILRKVLLATVAVTGMFFVEKLLMHGLYVSLASCMRAPRNFFQPIVRSLP